MQDYQKKQIEEFLDKMKALMIAKGHDYAGDDTLANFREVNKIGIDTPASVFVRLSDKYMRLARFLKTGKLAVEEEKIEDTLLDMANYAVLMYVAIQESKLENK